MNDGSTKNLSKVIRIDESEIRGHLDEMMRGHRGRDAQRPVGRYLATT